MILAIKSHEFGIVAVVPLLRAKEGDTLVAQCINRGAYGRESAEVVLCAIAL